MTPTTEASDAQLVAKWCWPNEDWQRLCAENGPDFPFRWGGLHGAERVVIERGLAEQYGAELVAALGLFGRDVREWPVSADGEDFAKLATAPLEVRVRALAAVVRAQTEAQT
jgi:hypothetical protein